jgi:hypothetical protein
VKAEQTVDKTSLFNNDYFASEVSDLPEIDIVFEPSPLSDSFAFIFNCSMLSVADNP